MDQMYQWHQVKNKLHQVVRFTNKYVDVQNDKDKFCPYPNKIKNSNNGTVSCDTFCAGQWEKFSSDCHSAIMGSDDKGWQSVDCDHVANPANPAQCGNDGKCLHCCCT